jgi:hypothetical protein
LGAFGRSLCITLFVALIVATVALAVPAFYPIEIDGWKFDSQTWNLAWLSGSVSLAVLSSLVYAILAAPPLPRVALEVDRRFGLKERLSSSLSMTAIDRESEFGHALLRDAEHSADEIRVADRFPLRPRRVGWLPLAIIPILAVVIALAEPAQRDAGQPESDIDPAVVAQVKKASLQLKKRIEQQKRKADAKGLKDARDLFEKLEADLNKITEKKDIDRKEAMIALNDLKKQLEERREQLGSSDQLKKAMSQMKSLQAGPAEEVSKSIAKGDFGKAQQVMKDLANKLKKGELSDREKQQLKKQIEQIKEQLEKAAQAQKQKQDQLKQQIEQAKREGRMQDAAKMQQQLNEMQQQSQQQMQQMQQMADQLGQAAQAMQNGDSQQAADALQNMADQLGDMQQEMSELKDLESALNDLSQSKEQMRCQSCGGGGCKQCQGQGSGLGQPGQGKGSGDKPGDGLGEGAGQGDRPEEETDTNTYETQVRGKVRKGKAVIAGFADGPNRKGISREDVQRAIDNSFSEESDPLENQQLPRTEADHARDYFNKLRAGTE